MLNLEPVTKHESKKLVFTYKPPSQDRMNNPLSELFAQYTARDYARIITETQPLIPRFQNNPIDCQQEGF